MWDMCQMLNIWHLSHTKHKNNSPLDIAYVVKLYHLCSYRCKFATVRTDVVNKKLLFYSTVDSVAVVDDNGNKIIYYFNV